MTVPCPKCGLGLQVEAAPRAHALADCPSPGCGARLVFTAGAVPFDPARHPFLLREWARARLDADEVARVTLAQRLLVRIVPAAACGILTGVVAALGWSAFRPEASLLPPFAIAASAATLGFALLFGSLHASDRRNIAKAMRFLNDRIEREGPVVRLRQEDERTG